MGLLDFGDRAMIQTLALRVGIGMLQMRDEMNKSPLNLPQIRGLAYAVCEEMKKMMNIANSLSQTSRNSLKIEYKGSKIFYDEFITTIIMKFQSDLMMKTQIDFYSYLKLVH